MVRNIKYSDCGNEKVKRTCMLMSGLKGLSSFVSFTFMCKTWEGVGHMYSCIKGPTHWFERERDIVPGLAVWPTIHCTCTVDQSWMGWVVSGWQAKHLCQLMPQLLWKPKITWLLDHIWSDSDIWEYQCFQTCVTEYFPMWGLGMAMRGTEEAIMLLVM